MSRRELPAGLATERVLVVAVDGPSGAGKSTVARLLATRLGWNYIDTGAMYRAIGLKADRLDVDLEDDAALAALCADTRLEFRRAGDGSEVLLLDGEDVSSAIREHRVSDLASRVSARQPVRQAMGRFQRELGEAAPAVLEGRDIGTVIFPDAAVKIFLSASAAVRARRRTDELLRRGQPADYQAVLADVRERDRRDSSREHAPLRRAADGVEVDTSELTIEQVVTRLCDLVRQAVTDRRQGEGKE